MDLRDLVRALLSYDGLAAREWVQQAERSGFAWSKTAQPADVDDRELSLAAALVELMAGRHGQGVPAWVPNAPSLSEPLFLVRAAERMPRLRAACMNDGPEPLRRRGFFAPEEFLTAA